MPFQDLFISKPTSREYSSELEDPHFRLLIKFTYYLFNRLVEDSLNRGADGLSGWPGLLVKEYKDQISVLHAVASKKSLIYWLRRAQLYYDVEKYYDEFSIVA